jgi:hypothetical protein
LPKPAPSAATASAADPLVGESLQGLPAPPQILPRAKPKPPAVVKPVKKTAPPVENLAAALQSLSQQQQLQARAPRNAEQPESGLSNVTTTSADSAYGPLATYSAKDFIRAQIARHWYLDRAAIGAGEFTVSLHLMLTADGRVSLAEIVDNQSFGSDAAYRAAAQSLRAAAEMSSPLALPPGHYAEVKDVVLTFSPKQVLQ